MSDCPTCHLPLVWSLEHERLWCSVYGSHPPVPPAPTWRVHVSKHPDRYGNDRCYQNMSASHARLIALVMAADDDARRAA